MFNAKTIILAKALRPDLNFASPGAEELIWLKIASRYASGNPVRNATIENGIATFGGVVASSPLVSLLLNIPITQSGSGTPSPDNVRDFIGVSGVNISQISNGQYASAFKGLLAGTHSFVDLGSLTWTKNDTTYSFTYFLGSTVSGMKIGLFDDKYACSAYPIHDGGRGSLPDDHAGSYSSGQARPVVRDDSKSNLTAEDFKSAMSGVYLIYELETPSTPVTPEQFATLCQAFGITGITYQITFGQTVYSAILDVLTGLLTVTHGIVDLGTLTWEEVTVFGGSNRAILIGNSSSTSIPCYSDKLKVVTSGLELLEDCIYPYNNGNYIYAKNEPSTLSGISLVYGLAKPIEIQLTPTQITTLIGENVIFADVANVTECKYTRK